MTPVARLAIQYNTPPTHALVYVKRPLTQLRGGPCSANVGVTLPTANRQRKLDRIPNRARTRLVGWTRPPDG